MLPPFRKLGRDTRGTTTIEFALAAIPTFMILFGTIEIGMMIFEEAVVEGATREAARKVRTGSVQASADPMGAFKQTFCANLFGVYDCNTFSFDVRTFSDFATISLPAIQYDAGGAPTNVVFQPGGAGTVTTVRVAHQYVFATPLVGSMMGTGASNSLPIVATAVFKTEPYQ
jgi:Flp pilus assembly protein TadG